MTATVININNVPYDSYATVAEADAVLNVDLRFSAAWTANTENDQKSRLLIYASRVIDSMNYKGEKTNAEKASQFPRDGEVKIPPEVEMATILLAGYYAAVPQTQTAPVDTRLKKFAVGDIEYEWFNNQPASASLIPFQPALDLLSEFLADSVTRSGSLSVNSGGNKAINDTSYAQDVA